MRLGFHYHVPAVSDAQGIRMPGYLGRFIDSLAQACEAVVCFLHSPRPDEADRMDYRIASPNVSLVDIGPHASIMERILRAGRYTSFLRRHASELDLLLVRGPSPLLPAMVSASPVPTALLLVGDYLAGVDDLPQPRWRKEAIRLWSRWNKWGQLDRPGSKSDLKHFMLALQCLDNSSQKAAGSRNAVSPPSHSLPPSGRAVERWFIGTSCIDDGP